MSQYYYKPLTSLDALPCMAWHEVNGTWHHVVAVSHTQNDTLIWSRKTRKHTLADGLQLYTRHKIEDKP